MAIVYLPWNVCDFVNIAYTPLAPNPTHALLQISKRDLTQTNAEINLNLI